MRLVGRSPARPAPVSDAEQPPASALSDDELLLLAAAGSRESFARLVGRHAGRLTSFCARLTGSAVVAEEISQDVWLQIWKRRAAYRPDGTFPAFLVTIARNRCRNHLRGLRRWTRVEPDVVTQSEVQIPSDEEHVGRLLQRERERLLLAALGKLPLRQREAVLVRFSEELDYDSIATILGVPASTARSRVFHGLRRLRDHLLGDSER